MPALEPICACCGASTVSAFAAMDLNQGMTREWHLWRSCPACRSLAIHPEPSDPGAYYPADYHPIPEGLPAFQQGLDRQRFKVGLLRQHLSAGRLIEIGPSFCEALWLAREAGFTVAGIERSQRCVRFAHEVLGLEGVVQRDDPAKALADGGAWDGITLWHVFEHLANPGQFLDSAASALNPGGVILIAQPNPRAIQLACFGARWAHLDTPRHLHLASIDGLDRMMVARGLRRCGLHFDDPGVRGWNRFGWTHSLAPALSRRRPGLSWRIAGRLTSMLASPFESGARASAYTAVYRKGSA